MNHRVRLMAFFVATGLAAAAPAWSAAEERELDRVVAVVNEHLITASELSEKARLFTQQLRSQGIRPPESGLLKKQALKQTMDRYLQLDLAKDRHIEATEDDVQAALNNIAQQNHFSVKELQRRVEHSGIVFSTFKNEIREKIIIERLQQQELTTPVNVDEADIKKIAARLKTVHGPQTQYHLQHILLSVKDPNDAKMIRKQKQVALQLRERSEEGEDFKHLASSYSNDEHAVQGGDWGWHTITTLPEPFVEQLRQLKPHQVSAPFLTGNGWHLIRLVDMRNANLPQGTLYQMKLRQILLKRTPYTTDLELRKRAQYLIQRLNQGESFESLARTHSEDPNTAPQGGELGWIVSNQLPSNMSRALEKLTPGRWTQQAVGTPYGYQILQVVEKKAIDASEQHLLDTARRQLFEKQQAERVETWLKQQRQLAYITINDPELKSELPGVVG